MSIKKSLLALVVLALAMMGLASSAMAATDGVLRDVTTNGIIPENKELHLVGWAAFAETANSGNKFECHVSSVVKTVGATGTEGSVTSFGIPNTSHCTGHGLLAGCTLSSSTTDNLPYHATVTPTDLDVTGTIVITNTFAGAFCPITGNKSLTFSEITLKPLGTVSKHAVTNTAGNLGTTAAAGEGISGVELSGAGTLDPSTAITASGELEISEATERSTWKIAAS
jgi:hypothetical protein